MAAIGRGIRVGSLATMGGGAALTIAPSTGVEGTPLDIDADGTELAGASSVELFVDAVSLGTDNTGPPFGPYTYAAPTPGPHSVTVEVDGGPAVGPVTLSITAVAPTLLEPDGDETITIGATFVLSASVYSDAVTTGVSFRVTGPSSYDQTFAGVDVGATWDYSWDTTGLAAGEYTVTATRDTAAADVSSSPATVDLEEASDLQLIHQTFIADGTWTQPATYYGLDDTPSRVDADCYGAGGGGQTATGGGGGGAFAASTGINPGANVTVTVGTGAANTNGEDSSFGAHVVAMGGLSRGNGGTGGTVAGSTGTTKYAGGDGVAGAGTVAGGGSGGNAAAGAASVGGEETGGFGQGGAVGRAPGGGGGSTAAAQSAGGRGEVVTRHREVAPTGYAYVYSSSQGRDTGNAITRDISLPTGSGGQLWCWVGCDGGGAALGMTGWSSHTRVDQATNVSGQWFYRNADGADPVALTSASESLSWICLRIYGPAATVPGTSTQSATPTAGTGANADPPECIDAGGSAAMLWLIGAAWDLSADGAPGITGFPTNYTNQVVQQGIGIGSAAACVCWRYATSDTENPGAFASIAEQHVVTTIAVRPS